MKYHIRSLAIILSLVMIFSVASVGCTRHGKTFRLRSAGF